MAILIAGGTKGIGLAIARRFAKPGVDVFLNYRHDETAAAAAAREIAGQGAHAHVLRGDVGTPDGAADLLRRVAAHTEHLDQIVHCAVQPLTGPLLQLDPAALSAAITLNGTSIVFLVQAALPLLKRGSTVTFISSRGSRLALPNYGAIGAGKALAESLMRYLVLELAPLGIRANCVAPGRVDTQALRQVHGDRTDQVLRQSAAENPSGRNVTDEDYAGMVEFLASPAGAMVQGQVIFINGGAYLHA
ncbi:SDR family oxidoreductase [Zavarzinia sp. CC-PAN008]|uniref:SDR family oxidoreductase n=1 Tax=Zavarzinia sp. CC-PAN008 TaxID=3243332 RepID=UPI003F7452CC